jgi:glycosyltransferase involved in cell wall biosynthesis
MATKPNGSGAPRDTLLREFDAIFKSSTIDFSRLAKLGKALGNEGLYKESKSCFKLCVDLILRCAAKSQVNQCLNFEALVYSNFVKTIETEEHYARCFEMWSKQLQDLGRKQTRALTKNRNPRRLCFFIPEGTLLGHTEVMLKLIGIWGAIGIDAEIFVAALSFEPNFSELLKDLQVQLIQPSKSPGWHVSENSFLDLRDQLEKLEIETMVWVSYPALASYALALRLAPRQVFWSLKFHPLRIPETDVYLCGGHESEVSRDYNGQQWVVAPFPLTVGVKENSPDHINSFRDQFPKDALILGSLAREEKLTSPDFLATLCSILVRNRHAHYVWTGRTQPPQILSAFNSSGISDRCHFAGWVNTNLVAGAIDIFLETFPFGCAVTGFQAMAHGTPVLSMQSADTLYGYQLLGDVRKRLKGAAPTRSDLESLGILTAIDAPHYIELAQRLIDDKEFRTEIGHREQSYYRSEEDAVPRYANRLWVQMSGVSI